MNPTAKRRSLLVLCIGGMLGLSAIVMAEANSSAAQASSLYQGSHEQLNAQLQQAGQLGYTTQDLQPVLDRESEVVAMPEPIWIGDRVGFYERQATSIQSIQAELKDRMASLKADAKAQADQDVGTAAARIARDGSIGVDQVDLEPLKTTLDGLQKTAAGSTRVADFRAVSSQAKSLNDKATQIGAAQEAENAALLAAAADLKAQKQGSIDELRKAGTAALAAGRNDATVATFLNQENQFSGGLTSVSKPYNAMERIASTMGSADPDQVATAAAGAIRYAARVHAALAAGLPKKAIVVSWSAQELWAYEGGNVVLDSLVTTGRPQLPTDIGPMSVLYKSSPWTMHSPWPKDSQWWYPDTVVNQVVWFTNTGEGMHDANWEFDYQYGPGGQYGGGASHGCIHVPTPNEQFLFAWSEVGTPVIVYPGDGSTVANQVSQITVDTNGQPTTGPKGA